VRYSWPPRIEELIEREIVVVALDVSIVVMGVV
jgi:hypothetical protein